MITYKQTPSSKAANYNNSFGFLRFSFAVFVLYFHTFVVGGFGEEPIAKAINYQETFGSIAVAGFFVISGYLVTQSLLRSRSIFEYLSKRFLRIYPGFWVCLITTAFVFAPLVYFISNDTLDGFIEYPNIGPLNYIRSNFTILMHEYKIANLLATNPYNYVFDGSLWTLFLEVKAYIFLAILAIFGLHKKRSIIMSIFLLLWMIILFGIPFQSSPNKYLRLIVDKDFLFFTTYFFAGAAFLLFQKEIKYNKNVFLLFVVAFLASALFGFLHQLLPIIAPYIILWSAFSLPFHKVSKLGDYSYGIYIYAFPIQQVLTFLGLNKNIITYFFLCLFVSLVFGYLSWKYVEKPALSLKRYLYKFHTVSIKNLTRDLCKKLFV